MAEAVDFINPIIQAYTAGRQHALERARLLQEQQQFGQRQELESKRLIQEHQEKEESLKQASDLAAAARDIQSRQLDMQASENAFKQKLAGIDQLQNVISGKVKPVSTGPNGEPPEGAFQIPGQEKLGYFAPNDPQAILARIEAEAKAKSGGEAAGQLPSRLTEIGAQGEQARQTQGQAQQFQSTEAQKNRDLEISENAKKLAKDEEIAKLSRGTQLSIAGMDNATRLRGQQLEYGGTPEANRAMAIDFATGGAKPNPANPRELNVLAGMQQNGMRPLDSKAAGDFQTYGQAQQTFQKMRDFANKYLPETSAGAALQGIRYSLPGSGSTEAKNALGDLNTQITNVGKFEEGLTGGRILSSQLANETNGWVNLNQTKAEALAHVNNLENQARQTLQSHVAGMPSSQIELINKTYGTSIPEKSPGYKYQHILADPKTGHQIGSDDGQKWYDVAAGTPIGQ